MSDNFNYAIPFILMHEGGLCNVTGDSGGLTNFGISQRSYPAVDIRGLTRNDAIAIYKRDFWNDEWDNLDKRVSAKIFDISVNCGMSWGPRILQRAIGVADDGIIGPATLAAASSLGSDSTLKNMVTQMDAHYEAIVAANPVDQKFLDGWEHRAAWIPSVS